MTKNNVDIIECLCDVVCGKFSEETECALRDERCIVYDAVMEEDKEIEELQNMGYYKFVKLEMVIVHFRIIYVLKEVDYMKYGTVMMTILDFMIVLRIIIIIDRGSNKFKSFDNVSNFFLAKFVLKISQKK